MKPSKNRRGTPHLGVVASCVNPPGTKQGAQSYPLSDSDLVQQVREGLPVWELDDLQKSLEVPLSEIAPILGISKSTLHRRRASGKLDSGESDRVVRVARLVGLAADVMESMQDGRRWLSTPQVGLGGEIPLRYAETEVGAREVEALLGRIDHGVYT